MSTSSKSSKKSQSHHDDSVWDMVRVVLEAFVIAILIRTFLFQPFFIPSSSMMSTLLIGDFIFVSKYSYGYSEASVPLGLWPFEGRVLAHEPKRGDVIVFKTFDRAAGREEDYIKRLIGLPGDRVQVRDGKLYLNGQTVSRQKIANFISSPQSSHRLRAETPQYRETLPNGKNYLTLDAIEDGDLDNTKEYRVPEGHYFFMGDNRDNSSDSRVSTGVGFVPFEKLVGRADLIVASFDESATLLNPLSWISSLRSDRFFKKIQ